MALIYTRLAENSDIKEIMPIINDAIAFLKDSGSSQWQSGYPNEDTISEDIKNKHGYVLLVDNQIAGYAAVISGIEPTYSEIDGAWHNDKELYATIHRMAISRYFRGMHLASYFFSTLISLKYATDVRNFRIDTFSKNKVMQHIALSAGFEKRGIIQVDDPIDPSRFAYELNL